MNPNSLDDDEPGCSYSTQTIKAVETENKFKEVGTCVLLPQPEKKSSQENRNLDLNKNATMKYSGNNIDPCIQYTPDQQVNLRNSESTVSKELAIYEPHPESTSLVKSFGNEDNSLSFDQNPGHLENSDKRSARQSHVPLIFISRPPSFIVDNRSITGPITTQPYPTNTISMLRNPQSMFTSSIVNTPANSAVPPTLFIQALSKINQSSLSTTLMNQLQDIVKNSYVTSNGNLPLPQADLSAPNSITESAPPSYSFVVRQNSRRPQLMGTFIPSPSFIPLTPPPNYAAAFDIYVDNSAPPPRPRPVNYGFSPMPIVCPVCGAAGISVIHCKITLCTHLCAVLMCLFCCWFCVPLPYLMNSCKDVYHYCSNCRNYLGMYCPTNPETPTTLA